jgi:hypothetical protein
MTFLTVTELMLNLIIYSRMVQTCCFGREVVLGFVAAFGV